MDGWGRKQEAQNSSTTDDDAQRQVKRVPAHVTAHVPACFSARDVLHELCCTTYYTTPLCANMPDGHHQERLSVSLLQLGTNFGPDRHPAVQEQIPLVAMLFNVTEKVLCFHVGLLYEAKVRVYTSRLEELLSRTLY